MAKKRVVKKATPKKRSGTKAAKGRARSSARKATGAKKKPARRRSAAGTLDNVRLAGERTWNALKSTTSQVVEGVKDTFGPADGGNRR
jgi:hypothetical protein